MKQVIMVVVTVFMVFPAFGTPASGFCVYNETDATIRFTQTSGGNFSKDVFPVDGKACCNWQDKSCNRNGGKRTSNVTIKAEYTKCDPVCRWIEFCRETFDAGGYMKVRGRYDSAENIIDLRCNGYNVD